MNPTQLLTHFDRLSDAPDAIPRLRRFFLDLAVRGKLVDQDPKDEPASDLLKRIQAEKTRLGGGKKERTFSRVDEAPFDAPCGWEWVRIRQVTSDRGQTIPDRDFTYIDVTAINKEIGCISQTKVLSASEAPSRARKLVQAGDVLYSCVRPYLLNIAVVESAIVPSPIASTAFAVLNGFGLVLSKYLWIALRSPFMVESVETKMRGQAYPAINDSDFALLPFPLPPFAEQQRIVAKVDELMALCDRLAAAQAERESRRHRLVAASLQRLNEPAADTSAFRDHAGFQLRHLPRLTTRSEDIQQLRQTILNLAVLGRLTADWRCENLAARGASEIVDRLDDAHEKNGGHRRGNAAAATEGVHDLDSQNLPETWRLTDLRTAVYPDRPITYGILMPGPDTPGGVPYVRVADFPNDRLNLATIRRTTQEIESHYVRARLLPGDILLSIRGTVGRVCAVPAELQDANITQDTARLSIQPTLDVGFVTWFLRSPHAQQRMQKCTKGVAVRGINIGDVRALQLPVPPLAEQHRIVAKVDELMAVCDRLEAQLTATQTESRRLLEAVLHEALAGTA